MTVAEMSERMSHEEFLLWAALDDVRGHEQEQARKKQEQAARRR